MVSRIWGKCNGAEIRFAENEETGRWETTVPASDSNTYIIELWAEDEAGNTGYFATIRVIVDTATLCTRIEILRVGARFTVEEVRRALGGDPVRSQSGFAAVVEGGLLVDGVESKVVKCEVCGK